MEFLKYKMMKITLICFAILMIIVLFFPFIYSNTEVKQQQNNKQVQQETITNGQIARQVSNYDIKEEQNDESQDLHKSDNSKRYAVSIKDEQEHISESVTAEQEPATKPEQKPVIEPLEVIEE